VLEQVRKQLEKIITIVRVRDFKDIDYVERDLMLLRVSAPPEKRAEVVELANLFRGRIVDVAKQSLTVELSGPEAKLEAFVDMVKPYGIRELARTGIIAVQRGEQRDKNQNEKQDS
ncbi:MAG: acetolactate synthase small subunit, partial [Phycisphaerae bacterium]|nr:acetolactate synthase small subunit [Phycisphaerae bacterium]